MKKVIAIAAILAGVSIGTAMADTAVGPYQVTLIATDATGVSNPCGYVEMNGTFYAFSITATGANGPLLNASALARATGFDTWLYYNGTISCGDSGGNTLQSYSKVTRIYN